jgi:hypothetical protein
MQHRVWHSLRPVALNGATLTLPLPGGIWQCRDILSCHNWRPGILLNSLHCTGQAPPARILSVVPRVRKLSERSSQIGALTGEESVKTGSREAPEHLGCHQWG